MRNINTGSMFGYLWENLYYSILAFALYRNLLFCPIVGQEYKASVNILALCILGSVATGILLTYKKRRNSISSLVNVGSGCIIYFLASFWNITPSAIVVTACLAAIAVLLYLALVIINYREAQRNSTATAPAPFKWFASAMLSTRTIVSIIFLSLIVSVAIKPYLGFPIMERAASTTTENQTLSASTEGETIAKNIDTVLLLQEEYWTELTVDERLSVLRTIADIETNYLGIPEVDLCTEVLEENVLGHYVDETRTVTINLSYLATEPAREMLSTLCHEVYHSYQHRLVEFYDTLTAEEKELLIFYEASRYKDEFANYIDGNEDLEGYLAQYCERDSDNYAEEAILDYYHQIYAYNVQHGLYEEEEDK